MIGTSWKKPSSELDDLREWGLAMRRRRSRGGTRLSLYLMRNREQAQGASELKV
jgi:hypothetical protein